MRRLLAAALFAACGGVPPAHVAAPVAPPADALEPPRAADEREWHWFAPEPLEGTERKAKGQPPPFYPFVRGFKVYSACDVDTDDKGGAYIVCGRDVARIDGAKLDPKPFRDAPFGDDLPKQVSGTYPDDFWIKLEPRRDSLDDSPPLEKIDHFAHYHGKRVRLRGGKWTEFPSIEEMVPYRGGKLLLDLPPFNGPIDRTKPDCADFACAKLLPAFFAIDVEGPDFRSLAGRYAWIHQILKTDYAPAVDPKGPVYVLLRALDLASKKRVFGVARWAPGEGARFDVLPTPLGDGDAHLQTESRGSAADGTASFAVMTSKVPYGVTLDAATKDVTQWTVRFDGRAWSVTKTRPVPRPRSGDASAGDGELQEGPFVGPYRIDRQGFMKRRAPDGSEELVADGKYQQGTLRQIGPDDIVWEDPQANIFRTVQPEEVLTLTDNWGFLHPWPQPAKDDCDHPFVVIDVIDEAQLANLLREVHENAPGTERWGVLPPEHANVAVVEMHLFGHAIFGASFATMKDARAFQKKLPEWNLVTFGNSRGDGGIYCARPIAAKPFRR